MEPQEKARYTLSGKRIFQGYSLIAECPTSQSAADLFDRLNESTRLQARVEQLERERNELLAALADEDAFKAHNCSGSGIGCKTCRAHERLSLAVQACQHSVVFGEQPDTPAPILKESRPYPVLVVAAIIIRDGNVLLERRAPAGVEGLDDMWDLPGGKVECGEQPADALMREIREELGVTIWPLQLCPTLKLSVWTYPNVGEKHWLLAAYICELHGEPICGDRLAWRPIAELTLETVLRPDLEFIHWATEQPDTPETPALNLQGREQES